MSETKHAPGPWIAEQCEGSGFGIRNNLWGIAHVFSSPDACPTDPTEAYANARLIAAAPDLLAACKAAKEFLGSVPPEHVSGLNSVNAFDAGLKASRLISKAIAQTEAQE